MLFPFVPPGKEVRAFWIAMGVCAFMLAFMSRGELFGVFHPVKTARSQDEFESMTAAPRLRWRRRVWALLAVDVVLIPAWVAVLALGCLLVGRGVLASRMAVAGYAAGVLNVVEDVLLGCLRGYQPQRMAAATKVNRLKWVFFTVPVVYIWACLLLKIVHWAS